MKEIKQKILIEALIKKIKEIISEKDAHIKRNYFRERRSHQKKLFPRKTLTSKEKISL